MKRIDGYPAWVVRAATACWVCSAGAAGVLLASMHGASGGERAGLAAWVVFSLAMAAFARPRRRTEWAPMAVGGLPVTQSYASATTIEERREHATAVPPPEQH